MAGAPDGDRREVAAIRPIDEEESESEVEVVEGTEGERIRAEREQENVNISTPSATQDEDFFPTTTAATLLDFDDSFRLRPCSDIGDVATVVDGHLWIVCVCVCVLLKLRNRRS